MDNNPNNFSFDASQVAPATGGGVPEGRYNVAVIKAEAKPTSDGKSGLMEFTLNVLNGHHQGSAIRYRLNLWNQSEEAVKIARSELSTLCRVTNVWQLENVAAFAKFYGIPFQVVMRPQKAKPEYTEVGQLFDAQGNGPAQNAGGATQQPVNQQQQPTNQQQPANNQQQPNVGAGAGGGGWGSPPEQQVGRGTAQQQPQQGAQGGQGTQQPQAGWGAQNNAGGGAQQTEQPAQGGWGAGAQGGGQSQPANTGNGSGWQAPA